MDYDKSDVVFNDIKDLQGQINNDISELTRGTIKEVSNLKTHIINEFNEEFGSPQERKIPAMLQKMSKFIELRHNLQTSSSSILNGMYDRWCEQLKDIKETILYELEVNVKKITLESSDFISASTSSDSKKRKRSPETPDVSFSDETENDETSVPTTSTNSGVKKQKHSSETLDESFSDQDKASEEKAETIATRGKKRDKKISETIKQKPGRRKSIRPAVVAKTTSSLRRSLRPAVVAETTPDLIILEDDEICEERTKSTAVRRRKSIRPPAALKAATGRRKSVRPPVSAVDLTLFDDESDKEQSEITETITKSTDVAENGASQTDEETIEPDDLFHAIWDHQAWYELSHIPDEDKIPSMPAIYQIKVRNAKKSAYIGACDSLRSTLLKIKNKESSGVKNLDKFIERNWNDIILQCVLCSTSKVAERKQAKQLADFCKNFKKNPPFNN